MAVYVALAPAAAVGQIERTPRTMQTLPEPSPVPDQGIRTIQDAIEALRRSGPGKSAPARVLGNPAEFFGPEAYPAEAVSAGQQGRSVVRIELDARGFPTGCTVVTSSASTVLDEATCRIAQTRLQYSAARDVKGKAVASQYTLPVRWVLPHDAEPERTFDLTDGRKAVVDVTVELRLDEAGKVASCRVVEQFPETADACAALPVGKSSELHAVRNGAASAAVMTMMTRVYLDQP